MTSEAPAPPAQQPDGPSLSEGRYEFRENENVTIERAGTSSTIWGACAIVGAVLLGILAAVQVYLDNLRGAILTLPLFLICVVAGWLYFGVGRSLKEVANTEGNDVEHLMRALDRLARAFRNEVIVTGIAVLVLVAAAVAVRL